MITTNERTNGAMMNSEFGLAPGGVSPPPPPPSSSSSLSSRSLLSSAGVGHNILFVISDAMARDSATTLSSDSGGRDAALEVWPAMYASLAESLAARGHQCHFVVSTFCEAGRRAREQLEAASLSVTAVQGTRGRRDGGGDLSSALAELRKSEPAAAPAADGVLVPDLENGLRADPAAMEGKEAVSALLESNFVDEALRLLLACADFRPTLVACGQSALHLAAPAALKHDAPLILVETSGPVLDLGSTHARSTPDLRRCDRAVALHHSLQTRKQLELANLLVKSLGLGKPFSAGEWSQVERSARRLYLASELGFCGGGELASCFDFLPGAPSLLGRTTAPGDETAGGPALVPAELDSPDSSHELSQRSSDLSLDQFLSFGDPVVGVWIDGEAIARQMGARNSHQVGRCVAEAADLVFGALADLNYKGLVLTCAPRGSTGEVGVAVEDGASLGSHCSGGSMAHVREVEVGSVREAVEILGRCKAVIHSGALSSTAAVSHLGVPSVVIPTPYFAASGRGPLGHKRAQLALQEHHLALALEGFGTAAVAAPFGSLSRPVLAAQLRRAAGDRGMSRRALDLARRLEDKDALADAVAMVEGTIAEYCEVPSGDSAEGADLAGSSSFSCMSCDELQSMGVTTGSVKCSQHKSRILYALQLEWTVREGEDKFRFDSLKGHGQLA